MKHLGTVLLKTDRLILRQFEESDAEQIYYSFINDDKFLYYTNKKKRTLEEEKKSLQGIKEKYKNKEYYNWLITIKDNTVIGAINLNVNNYNESVEFNYAIAEKYNSQGYMTEALKVVKHFCINKMKVNRFFGGCEINNNASRRVMEKCGLVYEGTLRNYLKLQDGYHDLMMYSFINKKDN